MAWLVASSVPKRLIVSWKRRGSASSVRPIASPSSTNVWAGNARTTSTTSGTRAVTSLRLRVKARTSSPARCTWMRAPSSFHSTEARPVAANASATDAALAASIGWTGRSTSKPISASAASPTVSARRAASARSPLSIAARRTAAAGTCAARGDRVGHQPGERTLAQLAGEETDDEVGLGRRRTREQLAEHCLAGGRRSRAGRRLDAVERVVELGHRHAVVGASARRRSACRLLPRTRVAQPTPIRPWRGSPVKRLTTVAISSGAHARSVAASASILVLRDRVAATARDVSTTALSNTPHRVRSDRSNATRSSAGKGVSNDAALEARPVRRRQPLDARRGWARADLG